MAKRKKNNTNDPNQLTISFPKVSKKNHYRQHVISKFNKGERLATAKQTSNSLKFQKFTPYPTAVINQTINKKDQSIKELDSLDYKNIISLRTEKKNKVIDEVQKEEEKVYLKPIDIEHYVPLQDFDFLPQELKIKINNSTFENPGIYLSKYSITLFELKFAYLSSEEYNIILKKFNYLNYTNNEDLNFSQIIKKQIQLEDPLISILKYLKWDFTYYPIPKRDGNDWLKLKEMVKKFYLDNRFGPKQALSIKDKYLRAEKLELKPEPELKKFIMSIYFNKVESELLI